MTQTITTKPLTDLILDSISLNNLDFPEIMDLYSEEGYTRKEIKRSINTLIENDRIVYDPFGNCFDIVLGGK